MSMELTWSSYASYRIPGRPSYSKLQQGNDHKQANVAKKKTPPDSLHFSHTSPVFLSVSDDHVLTQNEVTQYLELSERGDNTRWVPEPRNYFNVFSSSFSLFFLSFFFLLSARLLLYLVVFFFYPFHIYFISVVCFLSLYTPFLYTPLPPPFTVFAFLPTLFLCFSWPSFCWSSLFVPLLPILLLIFTLLPLPSLLFTCFLLFYYTTNFYLERVRHM